MTHMQPPGESCGVDESCAGNFTQVVARFGLAQGRGRSANHSGRHSPAALALLVLATIAMVWPSHVKAADETADKAADVTAAACEVIDTNESTTVMVCPEVVGLIAAGDEGIASLKVAASEACGLRAPCIVWIWGSRDDAPAKAPALSNELAAEHVQSAKGIWVNDATQFISIEAEKKSN